jgi:alpha-beta hydrolase superfamily lysophospholipase
LVLLGHSMGGLIAARFVAEGLQPQPGAAGRDPSMAWCCRRPRWTSAWARAEAAAGAAGPLAPNLRVANGLEPAWVSRDPEVVRRTEDDPLVHDRITPRLVRFIVDAGGRSCLRAPRWRVPTLLLWAGADRCVAPGRQRRLRCARAGSWSGIRPFPALYHEIFNEPEREQVLG